MSLQREAGVSQAVHTLTFTPTPWPGGIQQCWCLWSAGAAGMEAVSWLGNPWGARSQSQGSQGVCDTVQSHTELRLTPGTAGVGSRVTCFTRHCYLPPLID